MSLCQKRRSIRKYLDEPVSDAAIEAILRSAMQAPSARNQQPWRFVVIKNPKLLEQLGGISRGAWPLKGAPLGILTLIDEPENAKREMVPQDLAASTQNILLEATNQSLGAVWIGVYPLEDRMEKVRRILNLEQEDQPFSLIAIGHPAESTEPKASRYDPDRIEVVK